MVTGVAFRLPATFRPGHAAPLQWEAMKPPDAREAVTKDMAAHIALVNEQPAECET